MPACSAWPGESAPGDVAHQHCMDGSQGNVLGCGKDAKICAGVEEHATF